MSQAMNPRKCWIGGFAMAAMGLLPCAALALDFLESYEAALSEDSNYRAAQAQAEANREVVPMALAQLYPNVSGSYSRFRNDLNTSSKYQKPYDSRYPSSNLALTLRQPLYRPIQYVGYQQSKAKLEGVEATVSKAQQDAAVRVSSAYFNVLLAQDSLLVVLAQRDAIASQLAAAQKAFTAGAGARTDIDDAQARMDINRAQEISARQQIDQFRHELSILINRPVQDIHTLRADRLQLRPMEPDNLENWLERAESASPDLKNLRSDVESARMDVEQAKAGHLPTLDLIVQHSRNASDNVVNPDARYVNNQIGVQANVPLYAGGSVNAQVRSAQASLTESEERLEAARRKLATDVRKQFQTVLEGVAKVRALEQAERSADQAVLSNQKGFKAGTRSRLDILNAEQQRSQTRLDLAKERINYVLARVQVRALCGELNVDEVRTINSWLEAEPNNGAVISAVPANPSLPSDSGQSPVLTPSTQDKPTRAVPSQSQSVKLAINNWMTAWMSKDLASYLGAYAVDFKVPYQQSRKDWEKSRKTLIVDKKTPIQIVLSEIEITEYAGKATARFLQEYHAGTTVSTKYKVLELVRRDEKWLIKEERML